MNRQQIEDLARTVLKTGGPLSALLVQLGMQPGTVTTILTIALALVPPIVGYVWGLLAHTDANQAVAASTIPGVTVAVNPSAAAQPVIDAALANTNAVKLEP